MKAIVVMDLPKGCGDCWIRAWNREVGWVCPHHGYVDKYEDSRPDWCPLRPLPERKEEMDYLAAGYNKCLDDILEGE